MNHALRASQHAKRLIFWLLTVPPFFLLLEIGLYGTTYVAVPTAVRAGLVTITIYLLALRGYLKVSAVEKNLEDLAKRREDFYRMVSHDLKSPLAIITMYADVLLHDQPVSPNQVSDVARSIKRQCDDMRKLVEDVLLSQSAQAGVLKLNHGLIDLRPYLCDLLARISPVLKQAKVSVYAKAHNVKFFADPDRLDQILSNLITNAAQHTPECGVIELDAYKDGDSAVIVIKDPGPGIQPELLGKVFEPFSKGSPRGHGLGLSIVKDLVEAHGGHTWVESSPGHGTKFFVKIPLSGG